MNKPVHKFALMLIAAAAIAACSKPMDGADTKPAADPQTDAEKFGYAIGVDLGQSLKPVKDSVDIAALKLGLDEALAGTEPRMTEEAREEIKNSVARTLQQKQIEERTAKAKAAKEKGEAFLAENAKKDGVKTTESGLQYKILTEGEGKSPTKDDKVTVHYKGTLIDGTEFDSSYSRGQPVTFPLGNVIAGWTEGLQLMKVGGKAMLFIPADLAYGERGAGAKIGPNETLIFEVELLGIENGDKKEEKKDAKPAAKK